MWRNVLATSRREENLEIFEMARRAGLHEDGEHDDLTTDMTARITAKETGSSAQSAHRLLQT